MDESKIRKKKYRESKRIIEAADIKKKNKLGRKTSYKFSGEF